MTIIEQLTVPQIAQLRQLAAKRWEGVWAGDLIAKNSTRELIRMGYADNSGGSPAALDRVHITMEGRAALGRIVESCDHKWDGPWRDHADGRGGEVTCSKCGLGAMAHSLMVSR